MIKEANPHILIVGLGCPKQEKFMYIDRVLDLNPEKVKQCMDAGLLQYRKKANEIVARLMAKDDERTAAYREYEQESILLAPLYAVGKGAALTQESPIS